MLDELKESSTWLGAFDTAFGNLGSGHTKVGEENDQPTLNSSSSVGIT